MKYVRGLFWFLTLGGLAWRKKQRERTVDKQLEQLRNSHSTLRKELSEMRNSEAAEERSQEHPEPEMAPAQLPVSAPAQPVLRRAEAELLMKVSAAVGEAA